MRSVENPNNAVLRVLAFGLALVSVAARADQPTFDCVLEPSQSVRVGSSAVGILDSVMVKRGDFVERGQVLAQLKSAVETSVVEIHRAQSVSTARIKAQEARVEFVRKRLKRAKILWKKQMLSPDAYDELVSELSLAENELRRERLKHRIAQLEYAQSKIILEQLTIRSPSSGVVTERALSAGEFFHQEGHVVTIATLDPLHVEVFLPVTMFPKIEVGMSVVVQPSAPVTGRYEATVIAVDRVFDAASSSFGVRLSLANTNGALPAGHLCKVSFVPRRSLASGSENQ